MLIIEIEIQAELPIAQLRVDLLQGNGGFIGGVVHGPGEGYAVGQVDDRAGCGVRGGVHDAGACVGAHLPLKEYLTEGPMARGALAAEAKEARMAAAQIWSPRCAWCMLS